MGVFGVGRKAIVNSKVVPLPGIERQVTSPPIARASRREIVRPRPAPEREGAVLDGPCSNASKMRSIASGGMPSPLSLTQNRSSPSLMPTARPTWPRAVNFSALPMRLCSTCLTRDASISAAAGRPRSNSTSNASLRSSATGCSRSVTSRTVCAMSVGWAFSSMRSNSMRERSSRSPMTVTRCSAEWRSTSSRWRCSVDNGSTPTSWVMPMMPFSGVRSSWLTEARKRVFAALECSA